MAARRVAILGSSDLFDQLNCLEILDKCYIAGNHTIRLPIFQFYDQS